MDLDSDFIPSRTLFTSPYVLPQILPCHWCPCQIPTELYNKDLPTGVILPRPSSVLPSAFDIEMEGQSIRVSIAVPSYPFCSVLNMKSNLLNMTGDDVTARSTRNGETCVKATSELFPWFLFRYSPPDGHYTLVFTYTIWHPSTKTCYQASGQLLLNVKDPYVLYPSKVVFIVPQTHMLSNRTRRERRRVGAQWIIPMGIN